jgi:hypothetical protein
MGGRGAGSNGTTGTSKKEAKKEPSSSGGKELSTNKALEKYQNEGVYRPLNKNLRQDTNEKMSKEEKQVQKAMDKAMKESDGKMILYRGIGNTMGAQIAKAGALGIIKDKGFASTSKVKSVAHSGSFSRGWKATITVPKGTKNIDVNKTMGRKSKIKEEHEVIMGRGQRYGVMKVNGSSKTVHLIALKKGQSVTDAIMNL